ncbi:hypothetical protein DEO72_LG10g1523 [Vigna unguiculata]|uniref:Uncharacterized protein n=1 Tax=Vigna unguiculata TaxID=3917 RepID=A0A4D6NDR7_VIGUN|nr:hypothetical protein DEO72_LG10g1523 [Vigna unguiculata]
MFAWWWRDAGTLAERQREGPLPEQRGRRRDDTAAGGWRGFLVESRGERRRDSGGRGLACSRGFLAGSRGEKEETTTGWQWQWQHRSSARWWPELQREMEGERARGRKGLQF